jgi:hypothetical protein
VPEIKEARLFFSSASCKLIECRHIYVSFQINDFFGGTGKKVQKILKHLKLKK